MTKNDSIEKINDDGTNRSWWEKNGPVIYGIGVFVGLAVIGAIHSLLGT